MARVKNLLNCILCGVSRTSEYTEERCPTCGVPMRFIRQVEVPCDAT